MKYKSRSSSRKLAIVSLCAVFAGACVEPELNDRNAGAAPAGATCSFRDTFRLIGGVRAGGGITSDKAYTSNDGVSWTHTSTLPSEVAGGLVAFTNDGRLAYVGGIDTLGTVKDTIYLSNSTSPTSWTTSVTTLPDERSFFSSVYFNGKYYIYGGFDNTTTVFDTIYSSSDGINWVTEATSLPDPLAAAEAIVFNNTVYLIGGWDGGADYHNKIYSSADGVTFNEVIGKTFPVNWASGIQNHAKYNGKIYILGGRQGLPNLDNPYDTIWSSTNGEDWVTEAFTLPDERAGHTVLVSDSRVWVFGGYDVTGPVFYNDTIWATSDFTNWTTVGNFPQGLFNLGLPVVPGCF